MLTADRCLHRPQQVWQSRHIEHDALATCVAPSHMNSIIIEIRKCALVVLHHVLPCKTWRTVQTEEDSNGPWHRHSFWKTFDMSASCGALSLVYHQVVISGLTSRNPTFPSCHLSCVAARRAGFLSATPIYQKPLAHPQPPHPSSW